MIPGLYDGRNKTFFMGAYEGIRLEALSSPIVSVPTALMRQGNFSEVTTPIRNPFTGQPFPGNIIPPAHAVADCAGASGVLPRAEPAGDRQQLPGPQRASTDNVDQVLTRVDQNLGNKVRLSVRYNWHDSYPSAARAITVQGITQPRVNKNTLVSYTHTLTPNLHNDFRIGYHRIDFDTLNHFSVNGIADAGASDWAFRGSTATSGTTIPGIPNINISNFSGLGGAGRTGIQFDTTFQMSNVLSYNRGTHNIRSGFDPRRLATGRRAANSPRGGRSRTSPATSPATRVADFMLGLPRTVIHRPIRFRDTSADGATASSSTTSGRRRAT